MNKRVNVKNPVIIIPSRLASVRLPNKPLADIVGVPMIVRVVQLAKEADVADVIVAAANQEIIDCVQDYGFKGVLTDPNLASGSDRIFQAISKIDKEEKFDAIINVQGDLPILDKSCIKDCLHLLQYYDFDITTLASEIKNNEEKNNPNVVKAVLSFANYSLDIAKALYFTRVAAPYGGGELYHHIGIYGYKRASLAKFTSLPPSLLEQRERLEQLRALENNMTIGVKISNTTALGVDTQEDLIEIRKIIEKEGSEKQ